MLWDDTVEGYDRLDLTRHCGGRVVLGFPPSIGGVDVRERVPGGSSFLSDEDLIGRVHATDDSVWTFAVQRVRADEIVPLPCGRQVIVGEWLIDVARPKNLERAPIFPVLGHIAAGPGLILHDHGFVACFGEGGMIWRSVGLFDANISDVEVKGGRLLCTGYLPWIEEERRFCVELDAATGRIVGGDPEVLEIHLRD